VAAELAGALWGEADVAADDDARIQDAADEPSSLMASTAASFRNRPAFSIAFSTEDW
jgi:hypothetical protein